LSKSRITILNYTCYSGFTQLYLLIWIYSIILVILDLLNYTCYSGFTQLYLLFWIYSIILVILDFLSGFASKFLFQNVMSCTHSLLNPSNTKKWRKYETDLRYCKKNYIETIRTSCKLITFWNRSLEAKPLRKSRITSIIE
jgi:hypothetical protein